MHHCRQFRSRFRCPWKSLPQFRPCFQNRCRRVSFRTNCRNDCRRTHCLRRRCPSQDCPRNRCAAAHRKGFRRWREYRRLSPCRWHTPATGRSSAWQRRHSVPEPADKTAGRSSETLPDKRFPEQLRLPGWQCRFPAGQCPGSRPQRWGRYHPHRQFSAPPVWPHIPSFASQGRPGRF